MPDDPDPPRKIYKLGEAKFERVNDPAPAAQSDAISNQAAGGAAPVEPTKLNDVHNMLLENRAVDKAGGLFDVDYRPRPSRRRRDYFILLIGGNLVFGGVVAHFGALSIPGLYASAGMIMFTAGLTWIMWVIVDNY